MATYSIKDLERLSGIKAHTIRIWEQRYHLIQPRRTDTNIRLYSDDDLVRLMNVAILNQHGYKISKIAQLKDPQFLDILSEINQSASNTEDHADGLTMAMINLDEPHFQRIVTASTEKIGFEATLEQLLFPFMVKIGELWLTGTIIPAQEHFVSHLVRQFLIAETASLKPPVTGRQPSILFYLPEGEHHDLGLLYYNYLARKTGYEVVYLGTSVPFRDIVQVENIRNVDIIFTSFVTSAVSEPLKIRIKKLKSAFPAKTFMVTGYQFKVEKATLPGNFHQIKNSAEFKTALAGFLKKWNLRDSDKTIS